MVAYCSTVMLSLSSHSSHSKWLKTTVTTVIRFHTRIIPELLDASRLKPPQCETPQVTSWKWRPTTPRFADQTAKVPLQIIWTYLKLCCLMLPFACDWIQFPLMLLASPGFKSLVSLGSYRQEVQHTRPLNAQPVSRCLLRILFSSSLGVPIRSAMWGSSNGLLHRTDCCLLLRRLQVLVHHNAWKCSAKPTCISLYNYILIRLQTYASPLAHLKPGDLYSIQIKW
jgi:hypothetical protein